ncbi:hypothetical protein [Tropicimonas sp.]|uniref:hypothetical protein n=1 Tax=Tropicimonas sp. TaxID=2067044 RepID=UPI003A840361
MMKIPGLEALTGRRLLVGTTLVLLVSLLLGQLAAGDPGLMFEESGTVTLASFFFLLAIARVNGRIFTLRRSKALPLWDDPAVIWALICLGFVFLAFDEVAEIHERADKWLHHILRLQETALSDRIDDFIIAIYGMTGLALIWRYRSEFAHSTRLRNWLGAGVGITFLSVILDMLGNRSDVLRAFGLSLQHADTVQGWIDIVEECCKLFAEVCLLSGFLCQWRDLRQKPAPLP